MWISDTNQGGPVESELAQLEADIAHVIACSGQTVHDADRGVVITHESRGVRVDWRTHDQHGLMEGNTANSAVINAGHWFVRAVLEQHARTHGWTVHPVGAGDERVGFSGPVRVSWRIDVPDSPGQLQDQDDEEGHAHAV